MLTLGDLKDYTENEVIEHLVNEYPEHETEIENARESLKDMEVLIAYESVGDYGCDSSSFFLLKNRLNGSLFEVHGSHCSCCGFEGQLNLEETAIEALKFRVNKAGDCFDTGGYDSEGRENTRKVNDFILGFNN